MSNDERESKASVTPIWTEAFMSEREPVLVSIRKNHAIVRVFHFDIEVIGKFESGDIEAVIAAYDKLMATKPTFIELPDDWEPTPWIPPDGFDPIADLYLEPEEEAHEVVYLPVAKRKD